MYDYWQTKYKLTVTTSYTTSGSCSYMILIMSSLVFLGAIADIHEGKFDYLNKIGISYISRLRPLGIVDMMKKDGCPIPFNKTSKG